MKIYKIISVVSLFLVFIMTGCDKALDKTNLQALDGSLIYGDANLVSLNLSYIYNSNLPGWFGNTDGSISGNGSFSDESFGSNDFMKGEVLLTTVGDIGTALSASNNYGKIRKINEFIRDVNAGSLAQDVKDQFTAQAYFLRAFRYFELVRLYGGVPLVLTPLGAVGDAAKLETFLPRNTTSECIKQIVEDLDFAIAHLPAKWTNSNDWGKITSGAAAAFKGRVLLTYASPQFNPGDLTERWQAAYDANVQAKTLLSTGGFGLNSSYDNMWFQEVNNPEAVLVTGFNTATTNGKANTYDAQTRPKYLSTSGGSNQPSWDLVKAYPMLDGKKPGTSTKYAYNDQLFYKNRDPRFNMTIAYNGSTWPLLNVSGYRLWTYYTVSGTDTATAEPNKNASSTGFYLRKAVNPALALSDLPYCGTDWMEIRYAEVLLNLAESACGINRISQGQEAYEGLIAVRKRAGVEAGDGLYGLAANMSRADLFTSILDERRIEFAFEGKRFWDLRRWRLIEKTLNDINATGHRTGLRLLLKSGSGIPNAATFASTRDGLNLDDIYTNYFKLEVRDMDKDFKINWKPEYYFFGIPTSAINNNPNLIQNNTWGGTFDPLL